MSDSYFELHFPDPVQHERDFFDRDKERTRIHALFEHGLPRPVVIVGERRIGKTSLHHISTPRLTQLGFTCIAPIITGYTLEGFTGELLREMCLRLGYPPSQTSMIDAQGNFHLHTLAEYINALQQIFQAVGNPTLVITLDEFDSFINSCAADERHRVLDFILHLIESQDVPLKFFFTMTYPSESIRHSYPTTFLSESDIIHLHPFDRPDTDAMILQLAAGHLAIAEETLPMVFRFSGGHPYFLKLLLEHFWENYHTSSPATPISPEMFQVALLSAIQDPRAEHSVTNLLHVHMTETERLFFSELVRAGGRLSSEQLRSKSWAAASDELVRRDYVLGDESEGYTFRIEFLYHFLKRRPHLLLTNPGMLRVEHGQVYRGQQAIALDEHERKLFFYLYDHQDARIVQINELFEHIMLGQKMSSDQRITLITQLVTSVRKKIEEDWHHPIHLIDAGLGYRLLIDR